MTHKFTTKSRSSQIGLSLIELLVAMILVLVILAGLISLFTSNKLSYNTQENISRIQDNFRFASEILQKELRSAGYYGCNKESAMVDTLNSLPFIADHEKPIEGFNATNTSSWHLDISPTGLTIGTADGNVARGGSDILVVRSAADQQLSLSTAMAVMSDDPAIQAGLNPPAFTVNDVAIISDCKRSAIFQVTGFTQATGVIAHATSGGSIGNNTSQLGVAPAFDIDADVMEFQTIVFFVGTSTNGTPSLKRKVNNDASETIINGVENMQVQYGLDTDGDRIANRYVNASDVAATDWAAVTSARISLLMLGQENSLPDNDIDPYTLLDETIDDTGTTITHAGDARFRQVVNMTVDIRNI